jgi:hypothetical protein
MNRKSITVFGAALALAFAAAQAHDTWFEPLPAPPGEVMFALGTGNRFPLAELAVDRQYFARSGCRGVDGATRPLEALRYTDKSTVLRSKAVGSGALACFVQLEPFEFELPPDKIEVYFKEIRPSPAVLAVWAGLRARGLPFIERYTKSARIDNGGDAAAFPVGTAMDVLRLSPTGPLSTGSEAGFQVLQDGKPLADFPVELVNERSPVGLWLRTDGEGRIRTRLTLPGRWLLRGTDLRLSPTDPTRWQSQFITYAFTVRR